MHVPGTVERACDAKSAPDGAVGEEMEGQHGVRGFAFPDNEEGNAEDADYEWSDDFCGAPLRGCAACDGEGLVLLATHHMAFWKR